MPASGIPSGSLKQKKRTSLFSLFTPKDCKVVHDTQHDSDTAKSSRRTSRPFSWMSEQGYSAHDSQQDSIRSSRSSLSRRSSIAKSFRNSWAQSSNPEPKTVDPLSSTTTSRGYTPRRAKAGFLNTATPLVDRIDE